MNSPKNTVYHPIHSDSTAKPTPTAAKLRVELKTQKTLETPNMNNIKVAKKIAGIDTSRYTNAVLSHIQEVSDRRMEQIPTDKYIYCILTLENAPRSKNQKDVEALVKSLVSGVHGTRSDYIRDAAAALTVADLTYLINNGTILQLNPDRAREFIKKNVQKFGIKVLDQSLSGEAGSKSVAKQNERNLKLAMVKLGTVDINSEAVKSTVKMLKKQKEVLTVNEIANDLSAKGIVPDSARSLVMTTLAIKSLGTTWPVELVWPPFPFGTGLGFSFDDLFSSATSAAESKTGTAPTSSAGSAASGATKILDSALDIWKTNKSADIKQMELDYQLKIAQEIAKTKNTPANTVTQDQMLQWMAANKAQADAMLAQSAKQNNVTIPQKSNTALYIAGAVGGAVLLSMAAALAFMSRKPKEKMA